MKINWPGTAMVLILTLLQFALLPFQAIAQEYETGAPAPMNPEFVNYINSRGLQKSLQAAVTGDEHAFGYIPEPIDMSYLKGQQANNPMALQAVALPASFDLRDLGKVTPVRNQGSCGACWSFATMGSVESNLLPGETWDFSENNLKNTAGWDWGHCDGGNATMGTAYLARWGGPIKESDDPYNTSSGVSPVGLTVQKHIKDVVFIPGRVGPLDNDNIKQALMNYGAIYTSYYHNDTNYKTSTHSYYYSGTSSSNHAVTIVGWDDNFPSTNFTGSPTGNGAFIIKNSWGVGWGESGYFYISYYDAKMGMDGSYLFRQAESPAIFSRIYQYDPLGATSHYGYNSNTGWFANIFTAAANENLAAVGFYTGALNSSYEIYIYTNVGANPTTGTMSGSTIGTIAEAGYHTVQLTSPIPLTTGLKFSIVVKLTTPNYNSPITLEYPIGGVLSPTASPGQSYTSRTGTGWSDITTIYNANTNVCLKGFATAAPTVTITSPVNGATGFAVNALITALFSEAMNPLTITTSTFTLNNGVSGIVTYDAQTYATTFTPSANLAYNTTYTATVTNSVTAAGGNPMAVAKTWSFTTALPVTLSVAVNGNGSVNSTPGGIACTTGPSGSCSNLFTSGETVTLTPAGIISPTFLSHFGYWTGICDSVNSVNCDVTMNANKIFTATFITNQPVQITGGSYYNSLQNAYNGGGGSCTIFAQAVELPAADFTLDMEKSIILEGGYDSPYFANIGGYTTLDGVLTLGTGTLTVENLIIK